MSAAPEAPEFEISVLDTKANLLNAAEGELKKIQKPYPDVLAKIKNEPYARWLSAACTHGNSISDMKKNQWNSKIFAHVSCSVAQKIEGAKFDFYGCEICGSTIDEAPETPCDICNYPIMHYHKVIRPV